MLKTSKWIPIIMDNLHRSINHTDPYTYTVKEYIEQKVSNKMINEFIFIIKPEIINIKEGVHTREILKSVFSLLENYKVDINGIKIINGKYIKKQEVVEKNWSILNFVAQHGNKYTGNFIQRKLNKIYFNDNYKIYGAFELIKYYPHISPTCLDLIARNVEVTKISAGIYSMLINIDGEKVIILNPFHPKQYEWFTKEENKFIILACKTTTNFHMIRNNMLGNFSPQMATEGSLRNDIFINKNYYNLKKVSELYNGFHISANLYEGMEAINIFFKKENEDLDTVLSSHLKEKTIDYISKNKMMNLYTYLEDENIDFVTKILKKLEKFDYEKWETYLDNRKSRGR